MISIEAIDTVVVLLPSGTFSLWYNYRVVLFPGGTITGGTITCGTFTAHRKGYTCFFKKSHSNDPINKFKEVKLLLHRVEGKDPQRSI